MSKAKEVRFKKRSPSTGDQIEIETIDGDWERVVITGGRGKIDGPLVAFTPEFDDGSIGIDSGNYYGEIVLANVNWRWVPR